MKRFSFKKIAVSSLSFVLAGLTAISPVAALEILATNYSMGAISTKISAQELCESAGLVSTDPTENVTWKCTSANLDTTKAGRYSVNIRAINSSNGDIETKSIQVQIKGTKANTSPVLMLSKDTESINVGQSINLAGYVSKAYDAEDGDLSNRVKIIGNVNTNRAGTYVITYRITDNAGVESTQTLTVTVIDNTRTSDTSNQTANGGSGSRSSASTDTNKSNTVNQTAEDKKVENGEQLPNTADTTSLTMSGITVIGIGLGSLLISRRKKEFTE